MPIDQEFIKNSQTIQQMAKTLNVDMGQAILDGKLQSFPYSDVVFGAANARKNALAWIG